MTRNYRKFYALLKQLPGAEKEALVLQFTHNRTDSLTAMWNTEFQLMLNTMEVNVRANNNNLLELNKWRKRVIASIGGWLTSCKTEHTIDLIKGIACRASKRNDFNEITLSELRALYAEFNNKQKVARNTENLQITNQKK